MPCGLVGTPRDGERIISYDDLFAMQKKGDRAARAACEMAKLIKAYDAADPVLNNKKAMTLFSQLSPKTQGWIRRHEKADKKRIAAEKAEAKRQELRSKALAKLTNKERDALRGMQL